MSHRTKIQELIESAEEALAFAKGEYTDSTINIPLATICVAKDFSKYPCGRYTNLSKTSGEAFRELIEKTLGYFDRMVINLDGTDGYPSSWLEEVFGGLIRKDIMTYFDFISKIEFISKDKDLIIEIKEYAYEANEIKKQLKQKKKKK